MQAVQPAERFVAQQPRAQTIAVTRLSGAPEDEEILLQRASTVPLPRTPDIDDLRPRLTVPVNVGRPPHMAACFLDIRSRVWVSYRHSFPPLPDTELTSDVGWGCMIRAAQMLVANTLEIHLLQRGRCAEQRVMILMCCRMAADVAQCPGPRRAPIGPCAATLVLADAAQVIRLFDDDAQEYSPLSRTIDGSVSVQSQLQCTTFCGWAARRAACGSVRRPSAATSGMPPSRARFASDRSAAAFCRSDTGRSRSSRPSAYAPPNAPSLFTLRNSAMWRRTR